MCVICVYAAKIMIINWVFILIYKLFISIILFIPIIFIYVLLFNVLEVDKSVKKKARGRNHRRITKSILINAILVQFHQVNYSTKM